MATQTNHGKEHNTRGLPAIVPAGSMRIAENTFDSRSLGVGFMTISIEFLLTKYTFATGDIERYDHIVTHIQVLNRIADLFHYTDKFIANIGSSFKGRRC